MEYLLENSSEQIKRSLIDHVAYATTDTDKSFEIFSVLGFKNKLFYKRVIDKFGAYITKLQSDNGDILELVEPKLNQSVVSRLLQGQQASIYHSSFYTSNLIRTLETLKTVGAVIITEPMKIPYPATQLHCHYKTSHVFHPNVGLFEVTGPS